jgi:hypothetical protein
MSSLPVGTPIVLFCLDNLSFLAATEEGGLVPISKCVEEDDGYHVKGALVVAPERSIQFSVDQLQQIISEFSEYTLYIITPVTPRRLIRSSRLTEIFQPPQRGFFSVHAQLQLLENIFQLFTPHFTSPQLTSHLTMLTL